MKKAKLLFIALFALLSAATFAACVGGSDDTQPVQLTAPVVTIDTAAKKVSWNAVTNASGYSVQIDSNAPITNITKTEYSLADLLAPATYSIKVMANGDGTNYSNSPWSAAIEYTVGDKGKPQPIQLSAPVVTINSADKKASWNTVPNAVKYFVRIDYGTSMDNGILLEYSLVDLTIPGTYSIEVMAKGDDRYYFDSPWSTAKTHTISEETQVQQLSTPINLQASETTLTWDIVTDASGYRVKIDNQLPTDVSTNSYNLPLLEEGIHFLSVQAKGNGSNFGDSEWSEEYQHIVEFPEYIPLEVPSNVYIDGAIMRWDVDDDCSGYEVKVSNSSLTGFPQIYKIENKSTNYHSLVALIGGGTYGIQVRALGDKEVFDDSPWSETLDYVYGRLSIPSNILIDKATYTLTWGQVSGTGFDRYELVINGQVETLSSKTARSFNLKQLITIGEYMIKIRAVHIDNDILSSEFSQEYIYNFDTYQSGSGTAQAPYKIANVTQFASIKDFADKHFEMLNNIDCAFYVSENNSIFGTEFKGSFDGKSYKFTNLGYTLFDAVATDAIVKRFSAQIINPKNTESDLSGYIVGTNEGIIKNISVTGGAMSGISSIFANMNWGNISNCSVSVDSVSVSNANYFGGFLRRNNSGGMVEDCKLSASLITVSGGEYVGGFVYSNEGAIKYSSIEANLTVSNLSSNNSSYGYGNVGLFVDINVGSSYSKGIIEYCFAEGSINITASSTTYSVGGFVGANGGDISKSYTDVNIVASGNSTYFYAGGFAGMNYGLYSGSSSFTDCYSSGAFSITGGASNYFGGFIGRYFTGGTSIVFTRCFSVMQRTTVSGARQGGFAGDMGSTIGSGSSNNYFNSSLAGVTNAGFAGAASITQYSNAAVSARTTTQMHTVSTWLSAYSIATWDIKADAFPILKITNPNLPTISGVIERITKINTPINLLEGVSAMDKDGKPIGVSVSGIDYSIAGEVNITYTAVDEDGYTATLTGKLKIYGEPTITYTTKDAITETDTINAALFSATAQDTFGANVSVTASIIDGTLTGGALITVRLTAMDVSGMEKHIDIEGIKVYGSPTIDCEQPDYVLKSLYNLNASYGVTAVDSFGKPLTVMVTLISGTVAGGNTVTVELTATDSLGNTASQDVTVLIKNNIIAFDYQGADGGDSYADKTVELGQSIGTLPAPTKTGYRFDGWFTLPNDMGTEFSVSASIDGMSDTTLYAKWTAIDYEIEYILNGGTNNTNNPTSYTIETSIVLQDPTKDHYSFTNWSPGGMIAAGNTGKKTFTANWTPVSYTINYVLNGGTNHAENPSTYAIESDTIILQSPTKTGYTFNGWTEGNTIVSGSTGTKTFTANWTANTYTIQFDTNGGMGIMQPQSRVYDDGIALSVNLFVHDDHHFISWNTEANGSGISFQSLSTVNITSVNSAVVTLYAQWEYDYTYTLSGNNATITGYIGSKTVLDIPEQFHNYTVVAIGANAFQNNVAFTNVIIPNTVTSIGTATFSGCSGLTSITLPFAGQSNTATGNNAKFGYIFGTSNYTGGTAVNQNGVIYYIPTTLKTVEITYASSINSYAFYNCSGLTSITIPDSVTSIGVLAFSNTGIWNNIPDNNVLYLGKWAMGYKGTLNGTLSLESNTLAIYGYAFQNCTGLTSITIPDSVQSIGDYAFANCSGLTTVIIPDSVENIGSGAFSRCRGLTSITIPFVGQSKTATVNNATFGYIFGTLYSTEDISVFQNGVGYYIPSSLKTVIITGGENIMDEAFFGCSGLTSITILNGVTSIGYRAFYGCHGLTSITIPDSVESIGNGAFNYCSKLMSITIPFVGKNKTATGNDALFGYLFGNSSSTGLTAVYQNGVAYYIPTTLKTIIITSATSIGDYTFSNCSGLTSIIIPNSVTSIGDWAFSGCSGLTSVYYGGVDATEWNDIMIGGSNTPLVSTTRYYYTEAYQSGNYWHWVDGIPTKWN